MATDADFDLAAFLDRIEAEQGVEARKAVERGISTEPVRKKPVPTIVGVKAKNPKPVPTMPAGTGGLSWLAAAKAARENGGETWWEKGHRENRERNWRLRQEAEERGDGGMSAEHKAALAEGRIQARAVKNYLDALESHRPKRGRKRELETFEADFIQHAKGYSEAKGITYNAWRAFGIRADVLKRAGISRAGS